MSGTERTGSLATRTVSGAGWLMGWRLASRLLGVVNTVVLVRLLVPADFGLVALATSFSFAIDSFSYLGVQEALVREHAPDRALYDTGFTMNALRGLLTAMIVALCAVPAAHFFGDARLVPIFLVLALALFMSALENIGTVDFQRDLSFGKQVQMMLVPRVTSMLATLAVAVIWRSYWALVVGILVARGMRLAFTYVIHPYRPRITLRAWRRLIGFSFWSWALLMAEGVPQIGFRVELFMTVLRLAILLVLVPELGLIGAAAGMAASGLLEEVIYLMITFRRARLPARALLAATWRPGLATCVIAVVLQAGGLTQTPGSEGVVPAVLMLAAAVLAGALSYGAALLAAWLMAGRPQGAETYCLPAAGTALRARRWAGGV